MASLNKVLLIGNLTYDPKLSYMPNGAAVINMRVAVNRKFRESSGVVKEDVCFVNVTAWEKQAENCAQYLKKSSKVLIEGILQSTSWETSEGQKRSSVEVRVERAQFLDNPIKTEGVDYVQAASV